ncbi:hypothetical protein NPIL_397161, partial [Nephila pilipes]
MEKQWVDVNLRWNASEYGGVADLRIPPWKIWKPDVLMYNRKTQAEGSFNTPRYKNSFPTPSRKQKGSDPSEPDTP